MGTAEETQRNKRALRQIEVAATTIPAISSGDPTDFGAAFPLAGTLGFMRACPAGVDSGGVCAAFVPALWNRVSVKALVVSAAVGAGDVVFGASVFNGVDPIQEVVVENFNELPSFDAPIVEIELLPEAVAIDYSFDMSAIPLMWARLGNSNDDTVAEGLQIIGFTFRKV